MWVPAALLTLESLLLAEQQTCAPYMCWNATTPHILFNDTTCIYYSNTTESDYLGESDTATYFTKKCTDHDTTYCAPIHYESVGNATNSTCQVPVQPPMAISWPGESCVNETYCNGGTCQSGICYGQQLGGLCNNDGQCSPGLFCNQTGGNCTFAYAANQLGCESDDQCQNNAGCNLGECVEYFSLSAGDSVENCDDGISYLCPGMTCVGATKGFQCTGVLQSSFSLSPPTECNITKENECPSKPDTGSTYYSRCTCGYNPEGKSYCAAFPGDVIDGYSYLAFLQLWTKSDAILQCNTQRRFTMECMQAHWNTTDFNNYTYAALQYLYYPSMFGMDSCTKAIYLQDYFTAYEKLTEEKDSAAVTVALAVGLILAC